MFHQPQCPPLPPARTQVLPNTQDRVKELLRKSLLGSEIIDTQFHLFSTKSVSPDGPRVTHPRALYANNVFLNENSKYFSDLLNTKAPSGTCQIETIGDAQEIPSDTSTDDYGYESDSDLEDDCPLQSPGITAPPPHSGLHAEPEDGVETFGVRPDSVVSDFFVWNKGVDQKPDEPEGDPSTSKVADQGSTQHTVFVQTTMLHSQTACRILVKDTAFQTWYALLYYLYTGEVTFSLESARTRGAMSGPLDVPKCSAKSMYRLASKVGLEPLREKALEFLRCNITEHNVLKELSSSLLCKYPPLLEVVLDGLYANIASEPVANGFSALAKRISENEVPHGASIVTGLYQRLLKTQHPVTLQSPKPSCKQRAKKKGKISRT